MTRQEPFASAQAFGPASPYERIVGRFIGELDPAHPLNAGIVDLGVLGSILGVAGVTLGLGAALLAWKVAIDIAWLRIVLFVAFMFVGLFLEAPSRARPAGRSRTRAHR